MKMQQNPKGSSQETKIMLVGKFSSWKAFQKFNCLKFPLRWKKTIWLLLEGPGPWLVMQMTCYTTNIGKKEKQKSQFPVDQK